MDFTGQVARLDPPQYLPPPPRRLVTEDINTLEIVTATVKGLTDMSSPTRVRDSPSKKDLLNSFLVRYFKTLNSTDTDIKANYPRSSTDSDNVFAETRYKAD